MNMLHHEQHTALLVRILKEIYSDPTLRICLGFKGGTAVYLFYDLPRQSVDLDFDLLDEHKKQKIFETIKSLLSRFGTLHEAIEKRYTLFFLLRYEKGKRNIKVEISKRPMKSEYELKNYLGIPVLLMKKEDLAANKLAAVLTRSKFASRDLFDLWFFLKNDWHINKNVVRDRLGLSLSEALNKTVQKIEGIKGSSLLSGLGELVDEKQKTWIKEKLKEELLFNINLYLKNLNKNEAG